MRPHDPGTLPGSVIYANILGHTPSSVPFYPLFLGEFKCNSQYSVDRKSYDSFILIYGNTAQKKVPNTAECDIIKPWINK